MHCISTRLVPLRFNLLHPAVVCHSAKVELESIVQHRTAALHKLSLQVLKLQDIERRRVARELHESVGQDFAGLKMNLDLARHFPHNAEVSAGREENSIHLTVADNGIGLDIKRVEQFNVSGAGMGVGLTSIRERVRELGGHCYLSSSPKGTTVRISVPLN